MSKRAYFRNSERLGLGRAAQGDKIGRLDICSLYPSTMFTTQYTYYVISLQCLVCWPSVILPIYNVYNTYYVLSVQNIAC